MYGDFSANLNLKKKIRKTKKIRDTALVKTRATVQLGGKQFKCSDCE